MGKSQPISRVIVRAVLSLITFSFLLLAGISVVYEFVRFNKQVALLQDEMYADQKQVLTNQVQQTIGFIEFSQKNIEQQLETELKNDVRSVEVLLSNYIASNANHSSEVELRQNLPRYLYSNCMFNNKLLVIRALNGEEIATVLPSNDSLSAQFLTSLPNHQNVIKELKMLEKSTENVLYQVVENADSIDRALVTTISYLKILKSLNWYISLQAHLPDYLNSSKPLFVSYLDDVYRKASYTPILYTSSGRLLSGSMFSYKPPYSLINFVDSYGVSIFNEINKVAWQRDGGYVHFYQSMEIGGKPEQVLGYFKALPNWNWIAGAYSNLNAIDQKIKEQAKEKRKDVAVRIFQILLILLITYLGIVFAMAYISKKFGPELGRFGNEVEKAVSSHTEINLETLKISELKELGLLLNEVLNVHFQVLNVLETKEEMYRLITENSNDAIFTIDVQGRIIFVTSSVEKLLGYQANELVGKRFLALLPPKSRKFVLSQLKRTSKIFQFDDNQVIDFEIINKNSEVLIVEVSLKCVRNQSRQFMFYSGIARNVTQSRSDRQALIESEKRYKLLADNINDVIWTTDLNLQTTYISPSVHRLEGYKPEERKALAIEKVLTPQSYQFISTLMNRILMDYAEGVKDFRNASELFDVEIIRKDGSTFWAEVNASLMFDLEGNVVGISGITRDISDRKKIEDALKSSEKKLIELNATKDKFFSILAHDLKNPFNSILGFSNELVQSYERYSDDERKAFVSTIRSSAQGAYQLLGNLLEWSALQTGRLSIQPTNFPIHQLINEVLFEVSGQILSKAIIVENLTEAQLQVKADRNMVSTVLRNFISNSIKFSNNQGSITIKSSTTGNIVTISVKDTGIGIQAETLNNLFKIQEKATTLGTAGEKGTGLGLILCKEFIENNNGKLWIQSKWQEGTTVFFTLPKV
jgi:PAS domain S-box-containing protein